MQVLLRYATINYSKNNDIYAPAFLPATTDPCLPDSEHEVTAPPAADTQACTRVDEVLGDYDGSRLHVWVHFGYLAVCSGCGLHTVFVSVIFGCLASACVYASVNCSYRFDITTHHRQGLRLEERRGRRRNCSFTDKFFEQLARRDNALSSHRGHCYSTKRIHRSVQRVIHE